MTIVAQSAEIARFCAGSTHTGILGAWQFLANVLHRRLHGKPFTTHEEKETDVNIGVHLVADAIREKFDRALVISADTDLCSTIRMARKQNDSVRVDVATPPGRFKPGELAPLFEISRGKLERSLLPCRLTSRDGREIARPSQYAPPNTVV